MKHSNAMKMDSNEFWANLQNIKESDDYTLRPTIMDISLSNTTCLYKQLTQDTMITTANSSFYNYVSQQILYAI